MRDMAWDIGWPVSHGYTLRTESVRRRLQLRVGAASVSCTLLTLYAASQPLSGSRSVFLYDRVWVWEGVGAGLGFVVVDMICGLEVGMMHRV
jgi:hypothetical protein